MSKASLSISIGCFQPLIYRSKAPLVHICMLRMDCSQSWCSKYLRGKISIKNPTGPSMEIDIHSHLSNRSLFFFLPVFKLMFIILDRQFGWWQALIVLGTSRNKLLAELRVVCNSQTNFTSLFEWADTWLFTGGPIGPCGGFTDYRSWTWRKFGHDKSFLNQQIFVKR